MVHLRTAAVVGCAAAASIAANLIAPLPATGRGTGPADRAADCVTVVDASPAGRTGGVASGADGITGGPGGAWFSRGGSIVRAGRVGVEPFAVPDIATADVGALAGSGSSVWFADPGNGRIGRMDDRGRVVGYPLPATSAGPARPQDLIAGDGGIWFTDPSADSIGRLDIVTGQVTSVAVPTAGSEPAALAGGRDGAVWFVERAAGKVARLADGVIREWPLAAGAAPAGVTVGPDGGVWFTESGLGRVGRIDGDGRLTEYPVAGGPTGITTGAGHAVYVALNEAGAVVRLDAEGRETGRWHLQGARGPQRVAQIDGDVWATDPVNDIVYRIRPTCTQPWVDVAVSDRAQAVLDAALRADRPGCSVAFGEKGRVVWTGVRGLADVDRGIPIAQRTIFDAGSIAKQFTAVAVLLLAQRHKLSLDDTLADHLDGFPAWARTVTLDQMLHHTTGIPEYVDLFDAKGYWRTDLVTQQMIVDELRAVTALNFPPGDHWDYSDSNYILLAEIVARVSGTDFPTFLRQNIFGPVGLAMVVDAINPIPGRAIGYDTDPDTGALRGNDNEQWQAVGEGALQTTPSELVRWADHYRKPLIGGQSLLAAQLADPVPTWPGGPLYGAGITIGASGQLWHPGSWIGYQSEFEVSADRTRSLAVFCNDWDLDMRPVVNPLREIWFGPAA